ncbi:hypothetical protein [Flavobacterium cerinum]|uniref:Uncharacterized protein n=1 Tax=Flavobacterium cerinum TaxID=2502784 RepID=A0A444HF33_9FLAO|nr:hypothetical protein [Flavobacterium cerinum]RWX03576.1 hypothetical protein EPI11_01205 [Flavobacterium cerinum]
MEDKELYTFFKNQKQVFNEVPSDSLWEKIECGLDTKIQQKPKPNSLVLFIKVSVIVAALVIVGIAYNVFTPKKEHTAPIKQIVEQNLPIKKTENIIRTIPVTTHQKELQSVQQNANDTVKRKKIKPETVKAIHFKAFTAILSPETDSIMKSRTTVITPLITTTTSPGRIIITTKDKISKNQFDELTLKALENNKNASGTMIIVRAPGHKIFRKVIQIPTSNFNIQNQDTVLNGITLKRYYTSGETLLIGEKNKILETKEAKTPKNDTLKISFEN